MDQTTQILTERAKTYGCFRNLAEIAQALKEVLHAQPGWAALDADMKESLEMNMSKIARILNGAPEHVDSWDDLAGYARLVADRLRGVER